MGAGGEASGWHHSNVQDIQYLPLRRIEEMGRFRLRRRGIWRLKRRVEFPRSIAQRDSENLHFRDPPPPAKGGASSVNSSLPDARNLTRLNAAD
jgi:hypothetical protein